MEEEYRVLCGKCGRYFEEDDLPLEKDIEDMAEVKEGEDDSWCLAHVCPFCHTDHYLGDVPLEDVDGPIEFH